MKSLVLDSNAIIALFDGDEEAREIIASAEKVRVPAIVLGEVKLGINGTKRGRATQKALEKFLDQPFVEVLNVGPETAECFVSIMKYLMEHGTPIPTNDVWIAAGTLETGSVLLTRDAHFASIPMIRTESGKNRAY